MTIYFLFEFIVGLICIIGGIGMIYIATRLNKDKVECVFMTFIFFLASIGFILGSMERPAPTKQDVLDHKAVYVSDTINNNGEKVVLYDIVWKDMLPENYE